ncbi:MAG: hypothetical protein WCI74_21555, partial [Actinomycetes bacterium]
MVVPHRAIRKLQNQVAVILSWNTIGVETSYGAKPGNQRLRPEFRPRLLPRLLILALLSTGTTATGGRVCVGRGAGVGVKGVSPGGRNEISTFFGDQQHGAAY